MYFHIFFSHPQTDMQTVSTPFPLSVQLQGTRHPWPHAVNTAHSSSSISAGKLFNGTKTFSNIQIYTEHNEE